MSNNLSLNSNSNSISGFGGLAGFFGGFSSGTVEVVGLIGFSESANIKTAGKNKVLKHRRMKQIVYKLSMLFFLNQPIFIQQFLQEISANNFQTCFDLRLKGTPYIIKIWIKGGRDIISFSFSLPIFPKIPIFVFLFLSALLKHTFSTIFKGQPREQKWRRTWMKPSSKSWRETEQKDRECSFPIQVAFLTL